MSEGSQGHRAARIAAEVARLEEIDRQVDAISDDEVEAACRAVIAEGRRRIEQGDQ